jgi:transposase
MNQLQSVAMSEGLQCRGGLRSKPGRERLALLPLAGWANRCRQDLLALLDLLNERVEDLTTAVQQEAEKSPEARLLMTHPGVGPVTALAFVLIIGYPERFQCGKQIGSYVGLIPEEASSGVHRRLGHISKQGSSLLRFLLVEAAQAAARFDPEWRNKFLHLAMRRERRIAKVAMARKLAVSLYWMWRKQRHFQPSVEVGSYAG